MASRRCALERFIDFQGGEFFFQRFSPLREYLVDIVFNNMDTGMEYLLYRYIERLSVPLEGVTMDFKGTSGIQITFDEDGSPRAYQDGGLCITRIRLDPAELAPEGIAEGDVFIREDLRTIIGKFVPPDDDIPDNDFFDDKAVRAGFMLGVFGLYNRLQIQEYRILLWENSQWSRVRARMGQERKRLILAAQRFQDQVLLCFEALLSTLV